MYTKLGDQLSPQALAFSVSMCPARWSLHVDEQRDFVQQQLLSSWYSQHNSDLRGYECQMAAERASSTFSVVPVMNLASSESRNATVLAISE